MLQNAYFLAKIGADTAENEQHFAEILPKTGNYPTSCRADPRHHPPWIKHTHKIVDTRSAGARGGPRGVSAPIFARKYAFFSIFQRLPDLPAEFLEIAKFADVATLAKISLNFQENC